MENIAYDKNDFLNFYSAKLLIFALTCFDGYRNKYRHATFLWSELKGLKILESKSNDSIFLKSHDKII